jgi:hypothetical protein
MYVCMYVYVQVCIHNSPYTYAKKITLHAKKRERDGY